MTTIRRLLPLAGVLGVLGIVSIPSAFAQCAVGTSDAVPVNSGPLAGAWQYTIQFEFQSLSLPKDRFVVDLDLAGCLCQCATAFSVEPRAGWSWGLPLAGGPIACKVEYSGQATCDGDPDVPSVTGPAILYEPMGDGCRPGAAGSGQVRFHSFLPPVSTGGWVERLHWVHEDIGPCAGVVRGDWPSCNCTVAVEASGWGRVKSRYR